MIMMVRHFPNADKSHSRGRGVGDSVSDSCDGTATKVCHNFNIEASIK